MKTINTKYAVALWLALLSACTSIPQTDPADPLEPINRTVFRFNEAVDRTIAVPIAKTYNKITPHPVRTAVSNFFSNLGDIGNAANNLMQAKLRDSAEDVMRLAINTVFGLGGLIDIATQARLPKHNQDFGLTLGRWGVPSGPYLVLPLFGPSSIRDAVGVAVNFQLDPVTYLPDEIRFPLFGLNFISTRASLLSTTTLLEQAALDKYSFVRDAYLQRRASLLHGAGTDQSEGLPDYGDEGSAP